MKKFLSLMLAMIMVMSLVTVGAGAAFTDAEDIQYTEAVDLMTGLGILQGPGDGTFNPKGNLSRAAAAKIIAYIALGAEKADKMTYDEVVFPDVELTSSTAPYIAWCAEQGIINGYKDGTFGRKNNVTGHAFLKMVLGAVGVYGQYTGTGWQNVVTVTAAEKGLLAGIDQDKVDLFSDPISRELACQIAFNAMNFSRLGVNGYLVEGTLFQGDNALLNASTYINLMKLDVAPRYVFVESGKLLEKVHKAAAPVTGVIVANQATGEKYTKIAALTTTLKDGKVDAITAIADTAADYNVTTELGDIGKVVTIYFDKTGKDGKVFSVTEKSTTKTVAKEIDKKDDMKAVFGDPTKIKDADEVLNFADYTGVEADAITGFSNTAYTAKVGTYVLYEGIILGYMAPANKTLTRVEDIDDTKDAKYITLTGYAPLENGVKSGSTTTDKVIEYADIAEDDFVVVTQIGKLYNLEKVATVSGKPTKIDDTTVTINGVEYKKFGTNNVPTEKKAVALSLTKEVTLYLDGQGNYIVATAVAGAEAVADIVYVANTYKIPVEGKDATYNEYGVMTGGTNDHNTYFAQIVTLDGTKAIYPITKAEYLSIKGADETKVDSLFKVTLEKGKDTDEAISGTGDSTKYVEATFADFQAITEKDELKIAAGVALDADLKTTSVKLNKDYYFDTEVSFLWISGDGSKLKVEVKDGVQALKKADVATVDVVYAVDEDSNLKAVQYVIIESAPKTETVYTGDVIYVVEDSTSAKQVATYTDKDNKTQIAYEHEVYVNGEKKPVALTDATITAGFKKWTAVAENIYDIEALTGNVVEGKAVESSFRGMVSFADVAAKDLDVAGVKVVDLTGATTKITDATKLTTKNVVNVVLEKAATSNTNTVVTIYVVE